MHKRRFCKDLPGEYPANLATYPNKKPEKTTTIYTITVLISNITNDDSNEVIIIDLINYRHDIALVYSYVF